MVEGDDAAGLATVVLLPVMHVFLDQSLVKSNDSLEQVYGLLAVIDFSSGELVDRSIISLKLARFEERDGILDERHGRQLGQVLIIIQALLARLNAAFELDYAPLDLVFGHKNGADHELFILQVIQLFQIIDTF